ncbi:MAG TPA: SMP-30/gluconolactonase/LRE family protein [Ilumatobacter sp.]|nr:SMP-30/gluconolactonase/LRE family protein [Ilumatobacter sp.]
MSSLAISADSAEMYALVAPDSVVVPLASGFEFTEGPTWSVAEQALYFSDIPGDTRYRWSDGAVTRVAHPTAKANGQTFDRGGRLIVCEHLTNAVVRFDADGRRTVLCDNYRGVALNSPNDLVVWSGDGSIYFTDPMIGRSGDWIGRQRAPDLGFRGVYRIGEEGGPAELVVAEDEFVNPNGLCFSPDESVLYINDSRRRAIKAFPVDDDGSLGPATELASAIGAELGSISCVDGMECDEHGNIWVTSPGGVWVFAASLQTGLRRLGVVRTPEDCASLVWGGADLRTLFLATRTSLRSLPTLCRSAPVPHHDL